MDAALELKPGDDVRQKVWVRHVERALYNTGDLTLAVRAATCFLPDEDGKDNAQQMYQEVVDTIIRFTQRVERLHVIAKKTKIKTNAGFDEVATKEAERFAMRRRVRAAKAKATANGHPSPYSCPTGASSSTSLDDDKSWHKVDRTEASSTPSAPPPPETLPCDTEPENALPAKPRRKEPEALPGAEVKGGELPSRHLHAVRARPPTPTPGATPTDEPALPPCTQRLEGPLRLKDDGSYTDTLTEGVNINIAPDGKCYTGCDAHPSYHGRQEIDRMLREEQLITSEALEKALYHRNPPPAVAYVVPNKGHDGAKP